MSDRDPVTVSLAFLSCAASIRRQLAAMRLDEQAVGMEEQPTREELGAIAETAAALPSSERSRDYLAWLIGQAIAELGKTPAETKEQDLRFLADEERVGADTEAIFERLARRHGADEKDLRDAVDEINERHRQFAEDELD